MHKLPAQALLDPRIGNTFALAIKTARHGAHHGIGKGNFRRWLHTHNLGRAGHHILRRGRQIIRDIPHTLRCTLRQA